MRKLLKSKKALSPVVAAIILIAVTVAVSIAVAAWMGSLTFTFMETEQIQITGFTVARVTTVDTMTVTIINTGATDVTIVSSTVSGLNVTGVTTTPSTTFDAAGVIHTIDLTLAGSVVEGSPYTIELVTAKNNRWAYTATAGAIS